jgi:hypothetical protein
VLPNVVLLPNAKIDGAPNVGVKEITNIGEDVPKVEVEEANVKGVSIMIARVAFFCSCTWAKKSHSLTTIASTRFSSISKISKTFLK